MDICNAHLPENLWRIKYGGENTFRNWVEPQKLNLTCVEGTVIGLMGSAYFLGFAISAGITPAISDKYGRKIPYILSLIMQTIAYAFIIWSKNIYMTIAFYLFVGLSAGGRVCIGSMYQAEFMP